MPVCNAQPHLDGAIRSILDQSHGNFEFVIYDDASTDGSTERLRDWALEDDRIRLYEGTRNLGPVGSSAFVVEQAAAQIIARMDADDLCSPDRLAREMEVLRANPAAGLVGTLFDIIDSHGRQIREPDRWRLARKSAFVPFAAHGSIMFRRAVFDQAGGYRVESEYWEDQDLVVRISWISDVLIIPSPLYQVRLWTRPSHGTPADLRMEALIDLLYRSSERMQKGESYDDLLREPLQEGRLVDPRVFISSGSRLLWAGGRPRLFRRLLNRGKLGLDRHTLVALAWTGWASLSPTSLRLFLKLLLKAKNARAGMIAPGDGLLKWSPGQPTAKAVSKDAS